MRTNKQILQVFARFYIKKENSYNLMEKQCRLYGTNKNRTALMNMESAGMTTVYELLTALNIDYDHLLPYIKAEKAAIAAKFPADDSDIPF